MLQYNNIFYISFILLPILFASKLYSNHTIDYMILSYSECTVSYHIIVILSFKLLNFSITTDFKFAKLSTQSTVLCTLYHSITYSTHKNNNHLPTKNEVIINLTYGPYSLTPVNNCNHNVYSNVYLIEHCVALILI